MCIYYAIPYFIIGFGPSKGSGHRFFTKGIQCLKMGLFVVIDIHNGTIRKNPARKSKMNLSIRSA